MRIRRIKILSWRNFADIEIRVAEDANLVCLVGANGTGKTHLLELIAACAHRLGLSQGIDSARGDPFADAHNFEFEMYLAHGVSSTLEMHFQSHAEFQNWDRTLVIESVRDAGGQRTTILAGGLPNRDAQTRAGEDAANILRQSREVHFVSLDADRAYPKANVNINEVAQAYETDWSAVDFTRGRSFRPTSTLYAEWVRYFLAQENQAGTRLMQSTRRARDEGKPDPVFDDHFAAYKSSVKSVLPHLQFTGVDAKKRTLLFDTSGMQLSFYHLSGGEREIAFLVGQIDRFQLRSGLFLLDEPELHLNADLIRTWVTYLTGTVSVGQVWLATHSLEAVEAAGQDATIVLERNVDTRQVDSAARLFERPILSVLSRAVGTPAFSLSQLRFLFIEGEDGIGERERFRRVCSAPPEFRFLECGNCNEVVRRVSAIRTLSQEAGHPIRVGGVIDRDLRSQAEIESIQTKSNVYVLPVHEIENYYLCPNTLTALAVRNGLNVDQASALLLSACDRRAGRWILQKALAELWRDEVPELPPNVRSILSPLGWQTIVDGGEKLVADIEAKLAWPEDVEAKFVRLLRASVSIFGRYRIQGDLWKVCEGKEVLNAIAPQIGFANGGALQRAALTYWEDSSAKVPPEVIHLRNYIGAL